MSFWDLSDGSSATDTATGEFETGGGNFEVIPDGSWLHGPITEAKWAEVKDASGNVEADYVSLTFTAMEPEEYLNRKVTLKLFVTDFDPKAKDETKAKTKRDKARSMLAAIDKNCGGKLGRKPSLPTNDELAMALHGKPMAFRCSVWEMTGNDGRSNSGNWISAVADRKSRPVLITETKAKAPAKSAGNGNGWGADLDDDIPF